MTTRCSVKTKVYRDHRTTALAIWLVLNVAWTYFLWPMLTTETDGLTPTTLTLMWAVFLAPWLGFTACLCLHYYQKVRRC
jgi:hypothetical protein